MPLNFGLPYGCGYLSIIISQRFFFNDGWLRWNFGIEGVADDESIEVRVFGIEMLYVP